VQLKKALNLTSTRAEVLEDLVDPGPEIKLLRSYRRWDRVKASYYDRYLRDQDANGVLHPNIKLHGTVSGRPSAENPNTQAIPVYDLKRQPEYRVKECFIARKGYIMVSADYAQAELRLGAWLADDMNMTRVIESGGDIHQSTADLVGIIRDFAKRINFGSVYGLGAPGLSKKLKISEEDAKQFLEQWHGIFTQIKPAYRHSQATARRDDYVRMWTGRMRRYNFPGAMRHKAWSNRVQGGVAEIMRLAIQKIDRTMVMQPHGIHMLLQVHDQILYEVPDNRHWKGRVAEVTRIMEDFPQIRPNMKVDNKVGERWSHLDKLEG
jgi:DNA polymerase-1